MSNVIFTFDTALGNASIIDSWMKYREYFKRENLRCVFFVGGWSRLSDLSKLNLKELEKDGHEIALHTETHRSVTAAMSDLDKYIRDEINSQESAMLADGFKKPMSFAYANCQTNGAIDRYFESSELLSNVKYIRACNGEYLLGENKVHSCVWLDNMTQNNTTPLIKYAIQRTLETRGTLVLAAHGIFFGDIKDTPYWQVNVSDLDFTIDQIQSSNLKSITYKDHFELSTVHSDEYVSSFNEDYYLRKHSDVHWAVQNKMMTSGKDHFEMFGKKEGREYSLIFKKGEK